MTTSRVLLIGERRFSCNQGSLCRFGDFAPNRKRPHRLSRTTVLAPVNPPALRVFFPGTFT
jgi:hypothetical protein